MNVFTELCFFSEQTCTFQSSEVATDDSFDLDECFATSLAPSIADTFTLTAARGGTSCTAECKPGFQKIGGSGEIKCLKKGNAEFGKKSISSFECRGRISMRMVVLIDFFCADKAVISSSNSVPCFLHSAVSFQNKRARSKFPT